MASCPYYVLQFILEVVAVQLDKFPVQILTEQMHQTLCDRVRTFADTHLPLPLKSMLGCIANLADAMRFLQRNNVIHRDVAARNCLVGAALEDVRLADFGMGRRLTDKVTEPRIEKQEERKKERMNE